MLKKVAFKLLQVICRHHCSFLSIAAAAIFLFPLIISSQQASAADGRWNVDADGLWSNPANWSPGSVADGIGATASFPETSKTTRTITLDSPQTVGRLMFFGYNDPKITTWALAGPGILTLATGGSSATVTAIASTKISAVIAGNKGLVSDGGGVLELTAPNIYSGTTVVAGELRAVDSMGLPSGSNLLLAGSTFQSRGLFTRSLGIGPGQVSWQNSAGFSAYGGPLTVRIGNSTDTLRWTMQYFLSTDKELFLNSTTANDLVDIQNGLQVRNGAAINVLDNPNSTSDRAMISGPISSVGGIGLVKKGPGTLVLTGANTYKSTYVEDGILQIGDGGTSGTLGTDSVSFGRGTLVFNRSDAFTVPNEFSATGVVVQDGEGTTTLTGRGALQMQINRGTLALDYSLYGTKIRDTSLLTIAEGTLELKGSAPFGQPIVERAGSVQITGTASITRSFGTTTLQVGEITFTPGASLNLSGDGIASALQRDYNGVLPNITVSERLAKRLVNGTGGIFALAESDYKKFERLGGKISSDWITNTCTIRASLNAPNEPITMATSGLTDINSFSNLADDGATEVVIGAGNTLRLGPYGVILNPSTSQPLTFTGGILTAGGNKNNTAGSLTINNNTTATIASSIGNNGTGAVSFTKIGKGTTYLTGNNTYTGDTVVGAGTLDISGSQATGARYWINKGANLITNNIRTTGVVFLDGSATIRANGELAGASRVGILEMATGAKLNLKDNDLVVGSLINPNRIRDAIVLGKTNNAAAGITSDMPDFGVRTGFGYAMGNNTALSSSLGGMLSGQSFSANSVLVKYTLLGDADLDGDTDLNDLGLWSNSYTGDLGTNTTSPTTFWTGGDFDYDGDTDLNDLGLWSSTYSGDLNGGAGSLVVNAPGASQEAIAILNSMGFTVVPEPSTILFAGLGIGALIRICQCKRRA